MKQEIKTHFWYVGDLFKVIFLQIKLRKQLKIHMRNLKHEL